MVDTPQYRALNPNGRVPMIEDGDFVLWESNTIVRYLCAKQASSWYPSDLKARQCRKMDGLDHFDPR